MMETRDPTVPMAVPATPKYERKPRFKRVPVENIALTERDVAICRHVYRHRFLRSTHLAALLGGSQQMIVRRLQLLYHHGYLDRPMEQLLSYHYEGSKPLVYGLGNKGADVLAHEAGIPRGKINWTAKNRAAGPIFLEHTLLTADVMVAFEVACQKHGGVRVIDPEELLAQAPEATRRRKNPLGWQVDVTDGGERYRLGVIPDKFFGLHYLDRPEGRNRAYFCLEADRATMPVMRTNLRQTSFYRKLLAYYETWQRGLHTEFYNIRNFRVLTVTSSAGRVKNLVEANRAATLGKGSKMFLFADDPSLRTADPLTYPWLDGSHATQMLAG